jgi:hypothetical protein
MRLAKEKVYIMDKLHISPHFPDWNEMKMMLEDLHRGKISTCEAIKLISEHTGFEISEIEKDLLFCYKTGLLECHITDVCDLNCIACHYRKKHNATIPFDTLDDYFNYLSPKATTVTGGGEPNCYSSQGKTLYDVTMKLKQVCPSMGIGLINNNTYIPKGNWYDFYDWQRTSVDAVNAEQYKQIKGEDKYDAVIENIEMFLKSKIPFVGIGFLYRTENIESIPAFLHQWYEKYIKMNTEEQKKFNIQFRPISPDIDVVDKYNVVDEPMERRMEAVIHEVRATAKMNTQYEKFLSDKTNFMSIDNQSGSYFLHAKHSFSHCFNALLHRVLRSDGTEYPDFLLCNRADSALGNVMQSNESPDKERMKIALGTFYYYHRLDSSHCCPNICRQSWVSNIIEENYDADISTLNIPQRFFF